MSKKFLLKVDKIDSLIRAGNTGSPKDLAKKMRLSLRCVYNYIALMRSRGAPIEYNRKLKTFYYCIDGKFLFGFVNETEDNLLTIRELKNE